MSSTTLFDSLGGSLATWTGIESSIYGTNAQSFSTGAGSVVLTDVQVDLSSGTTDGGTVTVTLWSDSLGSPGSDIVTLGTIADNSFANSGWVTVDLPVSNGPTLAANTRYWIELDSTSNSPAWGITGDDSGTGVASEYSDEGGAIDTDANQGAYQMLVVGDDTCFAAGTRILTARGEVPVEALRVGEPVVALRAGGLVPVAWIGRRHVDLRRHPRRAELNPVRVRAHAFGPDRPHRDLLLSQDHAVFIDGHLITLRYLLNGATIAQEAPDEVTYFHVELDQHDVLLAEGLAAESYRDVGNRAAFRNAGGPMQLHADFAPAAASAMPPCAPDLPRGAELAALRRSLLDRAVALGHVQTTEPDLRVIAGGTTLRPEREGQTWRVDLPAGTASVRLVSRSAVPSQLRAEHADGRRLGVAVTSLALDGVAVPLDDARLDAGWHAPEPTLRWTDGDARVATDGACALQLRLNPLLTYWDTAPAAVDVERTAA